MNSKLLKKLLLDNKNNIQNCKILCVGDIILDHYIYGNVHRISPEAPIPILLFEEENYQLGGAGNVARNLCKIGAKCSLMTLSGNDISSKKINKLILDEKNIKHLKVKLKDYETPTKIRLINNSVHLVRIDKENTNLKKTRYFNQKLLISLENTIKKSDLIILSDYNKGFLDEFLIQQIVKIAKKYNKIIIADPKKNDLSIYSGIDLLTPNQKEIEDASRKKLNTESEIIKFCRSIINSHNINEILLTRSEKGMLLIGSDYFKKYEANAKKVYDVTGAGDTVISILALMKAIGINSEISSQISNYVAGLVIGKFGTAALSFEELTS